MNEENSQCDGFAEMGEYLRETWHLGRRKFNLWAYLVVAVIGVGGVSIWLSLVFHYKDISMPAILLSICTFSPMIVSAGCFDYLFDIDKRRFLLGFSILVAFFVILLDAVSLVIKDCVCTSYTLSIIASLIALALWWIANVRNPKLDDRNDCLAPLGGAANKDPEGNEEGDYVL